MLQTINQNLKSNIYDKFVINIDKKLKSDYNKKGDDKYVIVF